MQVKGTIKMNGLMDWYMIQQLYMYIYDAWASESCGVAIYSFVVRKLNQS